jgi:transketolase
MMAADESIYFLYGDIGNNLFRKIKEDFPGRISNAGIAEASMVGMCAGLSQAGYTPVCYTINSFLYLKSLEQIKLDLAYPSRRAVLVGTGGGLSYASLGASHQSLEDYAVLGSIPNLRLYSPADAHELSYSLMDAMNSHSPSYLRIGKKGEVELEQSPNPLPGSHAFIRAMQPISGSGLAVVTVGTIGGLLADDFRQLRSVLSFDHYSMFRIRPWDASSVRDLLSGYSKILVVEDHYSVSGVYSLMLDAFSKSTGAPQVHSASIPLEFFTGFGGASEIRKSAGLDPISILDRVKALV